MLSPLLPKRALLWFVCACVCAFGESRPLNVAAYEFAAPSKDCTIEVRVTDSEGNPVEKAVVFLTLPYYVSDQIIQSALVSEETKDIYKMSVQDNIGLYIFYAVAPGYKMVGFPVITNDRVKKIPDIILRKTDDPADLAVSSDNKICRWTSIWENFVSRKRKNNASYRIAYKQAPVFRLNDIVVLDAEVYENNWGSELLGLSKEMSNEKDKETKAFLSICYIDLGMGNLQMQPASVDYALRSLPPESPFWSLSPQMPYSSIIQAAQGGGVMRAKGVMMYLLQMEKKHADPEVRAYAILRRIEYYDEKGNAGDRKKGCQLLQKEYAGTIAAKYVLSRYPHDFK
jgi:hypothetical protein